MEEEIKKEEVRVTPVEQSNFRLLLFIFVSISAAITYVMVKEYTKVYDFSEVLTNNFVTLLIAILSIVSAVAVVLFYAGRKLFRIIEVNADYEGEITTPPFEYPPAMINFLYDGFTKTGVDITVTILDLIRKGYIIMEPGKKLKDVLDDDISVKLEKNINGEELALKKYEIDLLRLIFAEIGDGKNTSTRSIRMELQVNPLYGPRITKWQNIMLIDLKEEGLVGEKSPKIMKKTFQVIGLIIILLVMFDVPIEVVLIAYATIQMLLAKAIFSDTTTRFFTSKGSDMYSKWMSYRKYLMNNKEEDSAIGAKKKIYSLALGLDVNNKSLFKVREKYKK